MKKETRNVKITIEKNIPYKKHKYEQVSKYPWLKMKVGDSFLTPIKITSLNTGRLLAQVKTGFRFASRTVKDGTRVWRIQ